MDMNRALGVNSGSGKRAARPGSLTRRRSTQRFYPQFEPKIEWMDTPEAHVLVAELPGFKKEEVRVQLDGGENVTISGGRLIQEQVLREGTWQPTRRMVSRFKRLFPIPKNIDIEGYTSKFENEKMYITFNKLKAAPAFKSTDILDQESKSIPQVGESRAKFTKELSEKMNDKASSNKLDQSLTDENVETPNVAKSNATQGENASNIKLDQSTKDEKVESLEDANSSATQNDKASRNKQDQSPRDEKLETPTGTKSTTTQDNKMSSNDLDQSPRNEKVDTPRGAKSTMAQDEKELSNKPHQIPRDEKVESSGGENSTMARDEKELSNKPYQVPREEMVEAPGGAESIVAQDEKELGNKAHQISIDNMVEAPRGTKSTLSQDEKESSNRPHQIPREEMVEAPEVVSFSATQDDKASSNKQEQNPKNEKLEILGVAESPTTQVDKVSNYKPDQSPRDEKVETPGGPKSTIAQDKELSSKTHQSPRDEMIENKDVAKSSVAQDEKSSNNKSSQSSRDEKVQTPEGTKFIAAQLHDDEKLGTPKVVSSSTTQEVIQESTQLEASNKPEELAKHPSSLNEENLVYSSTLPNQSELLDSKQEAEIKVGDQHEKNLNENPKVESTPLHAGKKQEENISSLKAKKPGDTFGSSQTKEDKHEKEKHSILKAFTCAPRFISRREVIVAGIAIFSLGLFISSKLA